MSKLPRPPQQMFKGYTEALSRFSDIYHPSVLNTASPCQGSVFGVALRAGRAHGAHTARTGERVRRLWLLRHSSQVYWWPCLFNDLPQPPFSKNLGVYFSSRAFQRFQGATFYNTDTFSIIRSTLLYGPCSKAAYKILALLPTPLLFGAPLTSISFPQYLINKSKRHAYSKVE